METVVIRRPDDSPATVVWKYKAGPAKENGALPFEAEVPYRQITWGGATEAEAVGAMLHGVAELARRGSIHADHPERPGVTPIQHAMTILSEHLDWHVERRREQIDHTNRKQNETPDSHDVELPNNPRLNRLNEIISGLATAIAALARVKEL